jgi:hypothetical protein
MPNEIVERSALRRIEVEIRVLAVSSDETVPLECAADALGNLLDERLQLALGGAAMPRNTGGDVPARDAPSSTSM